MRKIIVIVTLFGAPIGASASVAAKEVGCLSRILFAEAGHETVEGIQGVANTVMRRMEANKKVTPCSLIYSGAYKGKDGPDLLGPIFDAVSHLALSGNLPDVTQGATHFVSRREKAPPWTRRMRQTRAIGDHLFFKEVSR